MQRNILALIFIIGIVHFSATIAAAGPPNIVIFLSDDQGWGDFSLNGNRNLRTPNIDSLARDGAAFERFYVSPVCSPTRAEMLTGRYHPRGGVFSTSTGGERLDLDEVTMGDVFKKAGYATGAFGKWHNGMQYPYHPNGRGFDEFYGFCSGHWGHYFSPELEHNGRLVRGNGFVIDDFTDHALRFIEKHRAGPFLCYLPYCTPHSPMQVPDRFYEKFADGPLKMRHREPQQEDVPHTRAALAMCENIDWNVGRVLNKLDELNLAENTIVIYFTDNGPNGWRWNGGMKGRKGQTDEGGVRVPCLVRWPGKIAAGQRVPQIAAAIDLLPTLTALAGIKFEPEKPLDGINLKPVLTTNTNVWPDRMIFSHWARRVSVRNQRFRLDNGGKLFDMEADPGQMKDVTDEFPDVAKRMRAAVENWKMDVLSELGGMRRPFPVGYVKFPVTHLPARDGVPRGKIRRSARAPNCSFFTNWRSTDDRMTWDIEVETAGQYQVSIYYACRPEDVGSTIEVRFGEKRLRGKIAVPHDPPLVGAAQDRTPRRGESYVKEFKELKLGVMTLKQERGPLELRALDIAGEEVGEVRYVVLELVEKR